MSTLEDAFSNPDPSARLDAALSAGITPSLRDLDVLLSRCAVEPDFQVREMLTWALIRLPAEVVVPRLIGELSRKETQARSQALHTLSKFRDVSAWEAVAARLDDEDQGVVRTAWYAAVALVPENQRHWLAEKLAAGTILELHRPAVGEGAHGGLAGTVDASARHALQMRDRAVENDRTAVAKQWQGFLHGEHHRLHIDVVGVIDQFGR